MNQKNDRPSKGKLLVSAPFLDDIFKRSVIYLTEHNDEGSLGFIINKPLKYKASEIIEDLQNFEANVYLGGPVQQEMLNFIHKAGDKIDGSFEIGNGLYWGGNYETLKILAESGALNPEDFRFYLGYAGWSPGQLNEEYAQDSWIITNPDIETVFSSDYERMWSEVLRKKGGEYKIISTFPEDPSVN
ncbi:MAG TPA: YqgE/AlgH family protein [Ignavibacteria bacterium]|nr:YqgE/AlgH family protein [Ignavibacteria bacterium]